MDELNRQGVAAAFADRTRRLREESAGREAARDEAVAEATRLSDADIALNKALAVQAAKDVRSPQEQIKDAADLAKVQAQTKASVAAESLTAERLRDLELTSAERRRFGGLTAAQQAKLLQRKAEQAAKGSTKKEGLTPTQQLSLTKHLDASEEIIIANLNKPDMAPAIKTLNEQGDSKFFYRQGEVPGKIFGTNFEGEQVPLPIRNINGVDTQLTMSMIRDAAKKNKVSVEVILQGMGIIE
jgi:hypothetical protein